MSRRHRASRRRKRAKLAPTRRQEGKARSAPVGAAIARAQTPVAAPAEAATPKPAEPAAADPERAFERLAEDEALRRDLTDDAFGPLLSLSARLATARAERFTSTDELHRALRMFLGGAADYARTGGTADLAAGLGAFLTDAEARQIRMALASADSAEARASDLARSVAKALGFEETPK